MGFWAWYDRASRVDFAGTLVGFFFDWKTWLVWAGGTVLSLLVSSYGEWTPGLVWLAALIGGACMAIMYMAVRMFFAQRSKIGVSESGSAARFPSVGDFQEGRWELKLPPGPAPDWSLHDLFLHIDPDAFEDRNKDRISQEVKDNLSIGRLKSWGREIRGSRRLSLKEIMPHYWEAASFIYLFAADNTPGEWHARSEQGVDMADVKVSRAQALRIWPNTPEAQQETIPLHIAASEAYGATRGTIVSGMAESGEDPKYGINALTWYATYMAVTFKAPIYGQMRLSRRRELVNMGGFAFAMDGEAIIAKEIYGKRIWEKITIERSDLDRAIQKLQETAREVQ